MKHGFKMLFLFALVCSIQYEFNPRTNVFKTGKGEGIIKCDNGKTATVDMKVYGGWIAFGRSSFEGSGAFSPVADISELYGYYYAPGFDSGNAGGTEPIPVVSKKDVQLRFTNPGDGQSMGLSPGAALKLIRQK